MEACSGVWWCVVVVVGARVGTTVEGEVGATVVRF